MVKTEEPKTKTNGFTRRGGDGKKSWGEDEGGVNGEGDEKLGVEGKHRETRARAVCTVRGAMVLTHVCTMLGT